MASVRNRLPRYRSSISYDESVWIPMVASPGTLTRTRDSSRDGAAGVGTRPRIRCSRCPRLGPRTVGGACACAWMSWTRCRLSGVVTWERGDVESWNLLNLSFVVLQNGNTRRTMENRQHKIGVETIQSRKVMDLI